MPVTTPQHKPHLRLVAEFLRSERERRIRAAGSSRPRSIDAVPFRGRLRRSFLRLGGRLRGAMPGT
jgi:hypothetical protein